MSNTADTDAEADADADTDNFEKANGILKQCDQQCMKRNLQICGEETLK